MCACVRTTKGSVVTSNGIGSQLRSRSSLDPWNMPQSTSTRSSPEPATAAPDEPPRAPLRDVTRQREPVPVPAVPRNAMSAMAAILHKVAPGMWSPAGPRRQSPPQSRVHLGGTGTADGSYEVAVRKIRRRMRMPGGATKKLLGVGLEAGLVTAGLLTSGLMVSGCASAPGGPRADRGGAPGGSQRPALVVMVAVDQLRADLLDRYDPAFDGGFRRLREQGLWYTHTLVDHAITVSHPGHATLATGMHPGHHGIVDAAFYSGPPGHRVFTDAVEDAGSPIVGGPVVSGKPALGGASPRQFLATTLAEWIASASPDARVLAIGSGRYSSLLHAGRAKGDVYWYDGEAGRYVTSSYYRAADADWVARFKSDALQPIINEAVTWRNKGQQILGGL